MADRGDREGFVLTPPDHQGALLEDSYFLSLCDANTSKLKDTEAEYKTFYGSHEIIDDRPNF